MTEPWLTVRKAAVIQRIEDTFQLLFMELGSPDEHPEEKLDQAIERVIDEARRWGLSDAALVFARAVLEDAERQRRDDKAAGRTTISELYSNEWLDRLWKSLETALAMPELAWRIDEALILREVKRTGL